MPATLTNDALELLVRSLPPQALWSWLNDDQQASLRVRVMQGFRAAPATLHQPVARKRLTAHLQNTPGDAQALLDLWSRDTSEMLEAVRARDDDTALIPQLPELKKQYGQALQLALFFEERDAVLEVWENNGDSGHALPADAGTAAPDVAALRRQLQRAQKKIEELRGKTHDLKTSASQTQKQLQEKLRLQESQAREAMRATRQFEIRLEHLQEKWDVSEKERDRAERKTRKALTESQEAQTEAKTLRRQIHRLQQINEELRGKLATAQDAARPMPPASGKTNVTPQATLQTGTKAPVAASTLEEDTQKIQAAIDRNDETFVATLRRSLGAVHEQDNAACKKLLTQLRKSGRYYERVLRHATTRVLVDASNVARHDGPGKGKMEYLRAMRTELQRFNFFPILFVADASLPYHIDEPDEFRRMMKSGQILVSASGQEADEILARQARETGAYVVTNDRNFHRHLAPAFTPLRIGFRIEENVVFLDEF